MDTEEAFTLFQWPSLCDIGAYCTKTKDMALGLFNVAVSFTGCARAAKLILELLTPNDLVPELGD